MKGSVLYVAYPLLPMTEESCGGAEQVLGVTEREMRSRGWRTCLAAAQGSSPAGELFSTGAPAGAPDRFEQRDAEQNRRIIAMLRRDAYRFDLIHDMSGRFWRYADEVELPVLATLHLPRSFYPRELFNDIPRNVSFNCVSESQARSFSDLPRTMGVVQNGVELSRFRFSKSRDGYLLWMGRICEEKGTHLALEVAERAGSLVVLAGQVYPFSYHQQYFEREVAPRLERLGSRARLLHQLSLDNKVALLRRARALLLPTLAQETSSLVAMEAMACGTPVIAFRRGAVPEIVEDGVTGFLVDSVEEMAQAVVLAEQIDPAACRARVEKLYSAARMVDDYERMYSSVLDRWQPAAARAA
jgi:glycosyltransferase involved in cell wall biosynthesis